MGDLLVGDLLVGDLLVVVGDLAMVVGDLMCGTPRLGRPGRVWSPVPDFLATHSYTISD